MASLFEGLPDNLPKDKGAEDQGVQLPPELQGKSPAEIYETLAREHERVMQDHELRMKAAEYDKSKETSKNQQQQTQGGYNYPPQFQQSQQQGDEDDFDYVTNPDKFMDKQFEKRLGPIVQTTFQSLKETNKSHFMNQIGAEEWEKYGQEIEQFVSSLSPQVQVHPNAYKQAYNFVQANHLDEIVSSKADQKASEKLQRTLMKLGVDPEKLSELANDDEDVEPKDTVSNIFARHTGTRIPRSQPVKVEPNNSGGVKRGSRKLSPEEKKMAEQFGMSEDEYREYAALNSDLISTLGGE